MSPRRRARRGTAGLALVLSLAGCGARQGTLTAPSEATGAAAKAAKAPRDVQPYELLGGLPDDAEVLLRTSVAREHPLGPRLEPFVLAWPGWGKTLRRLTAHPLADLEWIDIVGPRDAAKERLAARTTVDDTAMETRLAASTDGSLRVATRGQPHLVTVAPPDAADAVATALRETHVVDPPASADEGLRARLPHPHVFFKVIPEEAQSGILRVYARGSGGAKAELELTCVDVAAASRVGAALREQVERTNGVLVRMLTHDLLGGLSLEMDGATVKLALPASREQLEALATLAAGLIPPEPP